MLETIERFVVEKGELRPADQPGSNFGLEPTGKLRWKSHGFWDCETVVPAESNNGIIVVTEIKTLFSIDNLVFPTNPSINGLFFALCDVQQQNTHMQMNLHGIYRIVVRINGKVGGKEISVNRFDGFVYYYPDGFFIGEGSPLQDERIIKRLVEKGKDAKMQKK